MIHLAVLAGLLAGCASEPSAVELATFLRDGHREAQWPLTVEKATITRMEKGTDASQYQIEFSARDRLTEDLYSPASLDDAYVHHKHDIGAFNLSLKKVDQLRMPERAAAAARVPAARQFAGFYRKVRSASEVFDWTGTATARLEGKSWKFGDLKSNLPAELTDKSLTRRNQMVSDAIVIGDGEAKGLAETIAEQQVFTAAIANAEKLMTTRLTRERQQVMDASTTGRSWLFSIPNRNGSPTQVRVRFLHRGDDGKVVVLLSGADQLVQRSVWAGEVGLPPLPHEPGGRPGPRPKPDGWSIRIQPVIRTEIQPLVELDEPIVLSTTETGLLQWSNVSPPVTLTADTKAISLPDFKAMAGELKTATAAGQVWESPIHLPGSTSRRIRMTITENRDDGKHLRVVFELADNPYVVATFDGSIDTSMEAIYGVPVRLKRGVVAGPASSMAYHLPIFKDDLLGQRTLNLALSLDDKRELYGGGLTLTRARSIAGFAATSAEWRKVIKPGSRWTGNVSFADKNLLKATITVAEVRDDGKYVRLTAEDPAVSNRFRVFEGSFDASDMASESFALTATAVGPAPFPTQHAGGQADLFGLSNESIRFRLLPGGKTLVGISRADELMSLTRDDSASSSLAAADFAKLWQSKLARGTRWRGSLENVGVNQTAEVELEITSDISGERTFTATIGVPKKPRTKIAFNGLLQIDSTALVNGYALDLTKITTNATKSESPILGSVSTGGHTYFRLNADGDTLIGYALPGPDEKGPEILSLKLVE
jgi:hypothetical protein